MQEILFYHMQSSFLGYRWTERVSYQLLLDFRKVLSNSNVVCVFLIYMLDEGIF